MKQGSANILNPILLYVKYVKIVGHQKSTILFIKVDCCLECIYYDHYHRIKLLRVPKYFDLQ